MIMGVIVSDLVEQLKRYMDKLNDEDISKDDAVMFWNILGVLGEISNSQKGGICLLINFKKCYVRNR